MRSEIGKYAFRIVCVALCNANMLNTWSFKIFSQFVLVFSVSIQSNGERERERGREKWGKVFEMFPTHLSIAFGRLCKWNCLKKITINIEKRWCCCDGSVYKNKYGTKAFGYRIHRMHAFSFQFSCSTFLPSISLVRHRRWSIAIYSIASHFMDGSNSLSFMPASTASNYPAWVTHLSDFLFHFYCRSSISLKCGCVVHNDFLRQCLSTCTTPVHPMYCVRMSHIHVFETVQCTPYRYIMTKPNDETNLLVTFVLVGKSKNATMLLSTPSVSNRIVLTLNECESFTIMMLTSQMLMFRGKWVPYSMPCEHAHFIAFPWANFNDIFIPFGVNFLNDENTFGQHAIQIQNLI